MNLITKPIKFYAHGIHFTKEDIALVNKLVETIRKNYIGSIELEIVDIGTIEIEEQDYDAHNISIALIFGKFIEEQTENHLKNLKIPIWTFPDIKKIHKKPENETTREIATLKIKEIIESLAYEIIEEKIIETKEELISTHMTVEKNGTTFGKIADICITEKEAEYLKRIKDLLAGSKIVIKKGDITIEVE